MGADEIESLVHFSFICIDQRAMIRRNPTPNYAVLDNEHPGCIGVLLFDELQANPLPSQFCRISQRIQPVKEFAIEGPFVDNPRLPCAPVLDHQPDIHGIRRTREAFAGELRQF